MSCVSSVSYCIVTVLYIILARPHWKTLFIINLITSRWFSRKCAKSKKKGNDLIKTRMKTTKCECRAKKRTNYQTRKRSINERISRGGEGMEDVWGYGDTIDIEYCVSYSWREPWCWVLYIYIEKKLYVYLLFSPSQFFLLIGKFLFFSPCWEPNIKYICSEKFSCKKTPFFERTFKII